MRIVLVAALALLCACVSGSPEQELSVAEREIGGGDLDHGVRRMARAYQQLDVTDPRSWDHLGELAGDVDREIARRAYEHAEALRWPDPSPCNSTPLLLPFEGRWLVTQGNRGAFSHERLAERFAWDFQRVDAGGRSVSGDGRTPAEFLGYGSRIVAPADGVVVSLRDGVPDNSIGRRNEIWPGGNTLVLEHAPGEFSHFCHLLCGSILVTKGQSVHAGETIARCGCSGNAAEPHLHYVLRVGPTSDHDSVPARFDRMRILRAGVVVSDPDSVPQTGDVVEAVR